MKMASTIIVFLITTAASVFAQDAGPLTKLTKEDMNVISRDFGWGIRRHYESEEEARRRHIRVIKEYFATALAARKAGFADDPEAKRRLAEIALYTAARTYARERYGEDIYSEFKRVTAKQVADFYADPKNEAEFQQDLTAQIARAKLEDRMRQSDVLTAEQIASSKVSYARVRIYAKEAESQKASLGEKFLRDLDIKIKMEQAYYLREKYREREINPKRIPNKADIAEYIGTHPELATAPKKKKAESILRRARAGEDFAKLAMKYSDDTLSKDKGGLYRDIKPRQMALEIERTALALKPGQIAPKIVDTRYGFHIVKLERKSNDSYDVRHILVSTMVEGDRDFPRKLALADYLWNKVMLEKEKKILGKILADNPIEIDKDFVINVVPQGKLINVPLGNPPSNSPAVPLCCP